MEKCILTCTMNEDYFRLLGPIETSPEQCALLEKEVEVYNNHVNSLFEGSAPLSCYQNSEDRLIYYQIAHKIPEAWQIGGGVYHRGYYEPNPYYFSLHFEKDDGGETIEEYENSLKKESLGFNGTMEFLNLKFGELDTGSIGIGVLPVTYSILFQEQREELTSLLVGKKTEDVLRLSGFRPVYKINKEYKREVEIVQKGDTVSSIGEIFIDLSMDDNETLEDEADRA